MPFSRGFVRLVGIGGLTALHFGVSWATFLMAFGSRMGRFDSGRPATPVESVIQVAAAVLLFPFSILAVHLPAGWFPGLWGYIPFLLNSALWGCALYFLLVTLARRHP